MEIWAAVRKSVDTHGRIQYTQSQTYEEKLWKIRDLKSQVSYSMKVCLPVCVKDLF
jgi:hypothetical protein